MTIFDISWRWLCGMFDHAPESVPCGMLEGDNHHELRATPSDPPSDHRFMTAVHEIQNVFFRVCARTAVGKRGWVMPPGAAFCWSLQPTFVCLLGGQLCEVGGRGGRGGGGGSKAKLKCTRLARGKTVACTKSAQIEGFVISANRACGRLTDPYTRGLWGINYIRCWSIPSVFCTRGGG